jgi:hypothetical protein
VFARNVRRRRPEPGVDRKMLAATTCHPSGFTSNSRSTITPGYWRTYSISSVCRSRWLRRRS